MDAPLRGQWTRRIARILRVARFKQQDRRLYTGNGLVAVAARDDVRVAWRELNVSIIHPNRQLARKHEEELVCVRMAMTGELAANSRDPHVVIVDDADRDGRPALSQARCRGMNVQGIEQGKEAVPIWIGVIEASANRTGAGPWQAVGHRSAWARSRPALVPLLRQRAKRGDEGFPDCGITELADESGLGIQRGEARWVILARSAMECD